MNSAAKILCLFIGWFVWVPNTTLYAGNDGKKVKKYKVEKRKVPPAEFTDEYFAAQNQVDPMLDALRGKAKTSVNEVELQNRYVDFLSPADLNKLPIGLKKKVGNTTVKIAVSSAVFTPMYAELTVYAKLEIPQNNTSNQGGSTSNNKREIFFGVSGLKLSKDGGIIGNASLVLMGDYTIPLSGNKSSLVLKGGMDIATGQAFNKTYITIDCNGFKELGLTADVVFPRSILSPINEQTGAVIKDSSVTGSFSTVVSNWNDILATINLPAFAISGINGVGFKITTAVVDLSDYRNSTDMVYPPGYQQKYVGNDANVVNLWRGVYAKEIRVTLPKSMKDKTTSQPVSFGAKDLLIDNNGITGAFYGANVLPVEKGNAGGWQFSIDSFAVVLEANRLLRAAFNGQIGLPVNKTMTGTETAAERNKKLLNYAAMMSASGDYLCRVTMKDTLNFDVWKGNVQLYPNSYVELKGNSDQFKPMAMLNGKMNIDSKTGTDGNERLTKILDFKGIEFRALQIKTEAPYISADYFGLNGSIKLGSLPVTIDSIGLKSFGTDELGLAFNLKVGFQDGAFGGSTRLNIIGNYTQDQGIAKWQYNRLKVDSININCSLSAFTLNGTVIFMDNDPVFGDGFKGNILLKVPAGNVTVTAAAIFGNAGYKYWFVDGLATFNSIGAGIFNINGFGGGAYYRMKKVGFTNSFTPSGTNYVPDSTAGLGLRASVLFNVASEKLDDGQASLEVAFNRGGGLRFIGFYGYAKIMGSIKTGFAGGWNPAGFMKDQLQKVDTYIKNQSPAGLDTLLQKMNYQPTDAAKQITSTAIPDSFNVNFRAVLGITYDFNNKVFHANFDLFVSTPNNLLTGVGAGGRAGWAELHIDPAKWHLFMGTPTDPIGVKVALGPLSVQTGAYFMMGHDLPAFPPLPAALQAIMAQNGISYQSNIGIGEVGDIKAGKGVAFGANVQASTGDITFLILYANFQAGMGFDVMIKDYSNYVCQETGQMPGINGWYAQGRVYAYLQGEAGVKIKLAFVKKKIPIIKGAAVALLEGRLPNPSWFGGLLAINAQLLGGLIKVHLNLKFSMGNNCTLASNTNGDGGIDFDEFKVVTSVTPGNNSQNVSLFNKPLITCLTPPNVAFVLPPDDDNPNGPEESFRPQLTSINITKGTQAYTCSYKISNDGSSITVTPDFNYEPLTDYKLNVTITYQKLISGNWVTVTNNGLPATEVTTVNFKTGNYPTNIPDENIGFMYPYKGQKFLYKDEFNTGKVLLGNWAAQAPVLNSSTSWKARFINTATNQVLASTPVTVNSTDRTLVYAMPTGLQNNAAYKMGIYADAFVPGAYLSDTSLPILQCTFNTSQYGTLAAKLSALQLVQPIVGRVASDVIDLEAKVNNYEGFDPVEIAGNDITSHVPLISAEVVLSDNAFYNNTIKPLINYPTFFNITLSRDLSLLGAEPVRAMDVSSYYYNASLGSAYNTILFNRLPFIYGVDKIYNQDFNELRTKIVNTYMVTNLPTPPQPMYVTQCSGSWIFRRCYSVLAPAWQAFFNSPAYLNAMAGGSLTNIPYNMQNIVTSPFPFMPQGTYKSRLSVRRPVSWNGTSFNYEYGNWTNFEFQNPIQ